MSLRSAVFVMAALAVTAPGRAQSPAASSSHTTAPAPSPDNHYAAGQRVHVAQPVLGDVVVAGREVTIPHRVSGDILAAGWRITLSGQADDDVRVAAGEVVFDSPIAGDLTAAANTITVGPAARVMGRTWLTGSHVQMAGLFDREVEVAGGTVQISGEVRKPLHVIAERVEVLPGARILAPFSYQSPAEATIAAGAVVQGPITYQHIDARDARDARSFPVVSTVMFVAHMFVAGLFVLAVAPRLATSVTRTVRTRPAWHLVTGFVLLVTIPSAAILLTLTIVGIPVGVTLGIVFLLMLPIAVLATAFAVGDAEAALFRIPSLDTTGQRALALAAGILTLAFVRAVPVLGTLVMFGCVILGLGAVATWGYRQYQTA